MSRFVLVGLLAVGCGGPPEGGTTLVIGFEADQATARAEFLELSWVGGGKVFADERRVPATGPLPAEGTHLGTFEIEVSEPGAWRTLVARGVATRGVVSEGSARVFAVPEADTRVTLRLFPGRQPDDDGDGIPDAVDNCPGEKNRGQGACSGRRKDKDEEDEDGDDSRTRSAPPSPRGTLARGQACDRHADCETGRCLESRVGRFCASAGMAVIPGGPFVRGCNPGRDATCPREERPARLIVLSGFEIDRTEVTQRAYDLCLRAGGCPSPTAGWNPRTRPRHPVTHVTWRMADAYCRWADKRLPTEAEWEKTARGPADERLFPWGDEAPTCGRAQYQACGQIDAVPVGALWGASPYGVEDLAGNVSEWVSDFHDPDYYARAPAADPSGPRSGRARGRRGGAFSSETAQLRATARGYGEARDPATQGFRCARDL